MVETCSLTLYNINETVVLTCRSINCMLSFRTAMGRMRNTTEDSQNRLKISDIQTKQL